MSAITAPPQRGARRGHRRTRSRWNRSALGRSAAQLLLWPTVTPLATAIVVLLLTTTLLLRTHPGDIGTVVAWASTTLHTLAHHPVAALAGSMLVGNCTPLPEFVVVALSFAVLERAVGALRTAVIAL